MFVCVCVVVFLYKLRTTGSILMRFSINRPYGWQKWNGQQKKNFFQKSKMAAIFHEKIRENNYNSSYIRPMWMQFLIYESYWWYKYFKETDKSSINNAELQRIVLGTLETYITGGKLLGYGRILWYINGNSN